MTPRFGQVSGDYQQYRPGYAPRLYERLKRLGIGLPGQTVLDLGAGSGRFGRGFALPVVSVDPSLQLLRHASDPRIGAVGERLPFADGCFDAVVSADCWHWMDRDLAPREILRVLKPGGRVAAVYQMHVPMPGSIAEMTERLILDHVPGWAHANAAGINGQVLRDLQRMGFVAIESFTFDTVIHFSRNQWSGYVRTLSSVGASMSPDQLHRFNAAHEQLLQTGQADLLVPHRVFAAVARKPANAL